MDTKIESLELAISASWPPESWRDVHVVLAVSGGADSMAMLRAMAVTKRTSGGEGRLFVAHYDHRLRPESADDAVWLAEVCRGLDLPCEIGVAPTPDAVSHRGDGPEAAARADRYEFLVQIAEKVGARFVATAHTADDQVETVLHRIIRGTAIGGLSGIRQFRPLSTGVTLVRPMLHLTRNQVRKYLNSIGQEYRSDATNFQTKFTRNRLRHELLPLLRTINSNVDGAVTRLADLAAEAQQLIAEQSEELLRAAGTASPGCVEIDCSRLAGESPLLVRETCKLAWTAAGLPLQAMGFDQWQQLSALITGSSREVLNLPGNVRGERIGNRLQIAQVTQSL